MTQVLRNTAATLKQPFYVDGAPANVGAVTVTIARSDGTALAADAATTFDDVAKTYSFALARQPDLDLLTVTWKRDTSQETVTSTVEIVGGLLFSVVEARAFDGGAMANTTKYTDAAIESARTRITDWIQDATRVSWITRHQRATKDGTGTRHLWLPDREVTAVRAASIDGTALTASELDDVTAYEDGCITRKSGGVWGSGERNVIVSYEHGYPYLRNGVDRMALLWLRRVLVGSNIPDAVTAYTDEAGNNYRIGVPGQKRPSGIFEVDAWLLDNRYDDIVIA